MIFINTWRYFSQALLGQALTLPMLRQHKQCLGGTRKVVLGILTFLCLSLSACMGNDGEVLLSHLVNNRMTIVLKGTYASDNPLEWNEINSNQIFVDADDNLGALMHEALTNCDPYTSNACIPAYDELPIYIDVGSIRLSRDSSNIDRIRNNEDSEDFWDISSESRQVYCNRFYATNAGLDTCVQQDGRNKFNELMNGRGVIYPSRDVPDGPYSHTGIFVRRVVTGWSYRDTTLLEAFFDNTQVRGTNIISLVSSPPPPDEPGPAEWFPLHYRVGPGQTFDKGFGNFPVVLEMRFNMKENLMVHRYTIDPSGTPQNVRVIAFSDWRKAHMDDGTSEESIRLGGNVLARSRFFYPHQVSRIDITNAGMMPATHYYALYQSGETDRDNYLPYAATPARNGAGNQLNHIMPGSYQLECRQDANNDGYPEMRLGVPQDIIVPETPEIMNVTYTCP